MIKVKELIEFLKQVNPEFDVILSKDCEGNRFSPLAGSQSIGIYSPTTTYEGEFRTPLEDTKEPNALVLWPIN